MSYDRPVYRPSARLLSAPVSLHSKKPMSEPVAKAIHDKDEMGKQCVFEVVELEKEREEMRAKCADAERALSERVGVIDEFIVACGFSVNDGFEINSGKILELKAKHDKLMGIVERAWNAFDNGKRKHHTDALSGKCIVGCQACAVLEMKECIDASKLTEAK